jgi:two-component system chemotaxis sensor kinase CheA
MMNPELMNQYREEASELLAQIETSLLDLENTPEEIELVGYIFGAIHTIKGAGSMFGFDDIADFAHKVETVFDLVRDGNIPVSKELIDLSLASCDLIRKMVNEEEVDPEEVCGIVQGLMEMKGNEGGDDGKNEKKPESPAPQNPHQKFATYRIRFKPNPDILDTAIKLLPLLDEIHELGDSRVICRADGIPDLKGLQPERTYLSWDILLTTSQDLNAIRDVFIFVEDLANIKIDMIDEPESAEDIFDYKKIGEILVERGDLAAHELKQALERQTKLGEILVANQTVKKDAIASGLVEQQYVREMRKKRKDSASAATSIRVAADKLNKLMDLVGEMVMFQAYLTQKASRHKDPELRFISQGMERLTEELRYNTMKIRMLPISSIFGTFNRVVRDLSDELGKEVVMTLEGGDTELDKTVIERLNDPLVHIIRNCIDHGIEPPEAREAAGKPRQGNVHLAAQYSGASVLIRISDDGRGIDIASVRARAVKKGLVAPDAEITLEKAHEILFLQGFTTAEKVTGMSGRGVGMDVVKRSIESLQGTVSLDSESGRGTTISLKLPLTLAIVEGLLIKINDQKFVFPLSVIEECVEISRQEADKARSWRMMNFRGQPILYLNLRDIFGINGSEMPIEQVVISTADGKRVAFGVDHVVGQLHTVIKTLSKVYKEIKQVSGATILGDGTVALILDVNQIVRSIELSENISLKPLLEKELSITREKNP